MDGLTEKQKMLAGELYFPSSKALQQERLAAKKRCHAFNQCFPDEGNQARTIIKQLFGKTKGAWIEPPFYCDYGYNICTGKNFYANHGVVILDAAPVTFGDDIMIGPGVNISTATHPLEPSLRKKGLEQAKPIVIGNNVWLGMGCQILPGVSIGDNAVIGAGAVVTSDVPENTLFLGIPARKTKNLST